ncbi:protein O-mannosyl-transferase 2-like isoform X2 [Physella acuta]|nr:protein O-mannosyl-transferase 2-like isoform X2 [Physella acuta]
MDTQYVGMRMFCAVMGALLVPLSYQSVWLLTHSIPASIFAAALILFDTGTLTLSRHILLDPILMFFIMSATYSCLMFLTYKSSPFTLLWWLWMCVTGVCLACAIGVKFVGLFVIVLVGYTTATELWGLLSDLSISMVTLCHHVIARVIGLIILPLVVYSLFFALHFRVLDHSGNGDGFFSSGFQSQLIGNRLYNVSMPQYVAYGSEITLKQRRTGGAYLHSHPHLYPEEHPPKQQQVTTYSHKDENNKWRIKPADRDPPQELLYIHTGDLVRLEHVATRRNLHSHREPAPLSKHHYQVSGYGQNGTGDANDIWLLEVEGSSPGERIQTVRSKIKFIHYHVKCLLHSHDKKLPKWGWEQLEATCQPNLRDTTSVWSVEEVIDARLPNVSFEVYSPSFLEKFLESHAVMTQGNSGLKPKEGEMTSRPWQWPIDYRGQVFSGQDHRIYMLGNPVIFWFLLGVKAVFIIIWVSFSVCVKRKFSINPNLKVYCQRTLKVCWWLLIGWFLHYAPFWGMTRVLYFHHYFPAFLYSAMFGGVMLDFLITLLCVCVSDNLAMRIFHWCLVLIAAFILWSFYLFYPLTYGMFGPMASEENSSMHRLKWMESWDI